MKLKAIVISALSTTIMLQSAASLAADKSLVTDDQKLSYFFGVQIGQSMKSKDIKNIDIKVLSQGIDDALNGKQLKLSEDEMKAVVERFQKKMIAERDAQAKKSEAAGKKFLEENKKKPGVVTLPSGVQYKILTEGKGKKPTVNDSVVANYRGTVIDGTEFDSSYARGTPATFRVDGVIKGWQEILPMMSVGSKWRVFIPSEMAYGMHGAGNKIGPNETLIFDIELLDIKSQE